MVLLPDQQNGMAAQRKPPLIVKADPGKEELGPPPDWLLPINAAKVSRIKVPEIIKGVLYQGGKITIQGASKAYKTWIMLNLAYCIANGLPFLGIPTVRTRTYYANLELMDFDWADRLDQIGKAYGKGDQSNIDVVNLRGKTHKLTRERISQMAAVISNGNYLFFSLDPMYKLMAGKDESSNGEVTKLLQPFEQICTDTGASFAYAGHFSKGDQSNKNSLDRVSGAGAWARDPDCVLTLTEHTEADCFTAEFTLRSFPSIKPFVVRWHLPLLVRDTEGLDPENLKKPTKGAGRPKSDAREKIDVALRTAEVYGQLPALKVGQIETVTGVPRRSVYDAISKMNGRVVKSAIVKGGFQLSPAERAKFPISEDSNEENPCTD